MKHLLLLISVVLAGSISAQSLQPVNASIQMPVNQSAMNGANSLNKITSCSVDTNGYALAKATGLEALNINNATSAGAVSQYFDAPQSLTISGVSFYAWKPDATAGITMNVTVEIYAAAPDSTPTGLPLATTTILVDTVFAPGTLDVLRKHATFIAPVTVNAAYVVVISNATATPMSMVFNSWTAGDGLQEWLSSVLIGANWLRSYDVTVGGPLFDADCLFEPHVTYDLSANFTADDPCSLAGLALGFTNTSSPIIGNRMYNVAAFQALTEFSYTWDFGDGSPVENVLDASHTYGTAGPYALTLTDTLYGWTNNCVADTVMNLVIVDTPTASYSESATGLTVAFTNSSTSGAGATYLWDFGDGNTSTQTDPTHVYAIDGTYTVCLTVTDGCATNTTCNPITIGCPIPTPAFTSSATGATVDFTNTSISGMATYLWIFGDGNTATTMDASHTYATDGSYTVCLVVSDACGADSTCQTVVVTSCSNPVSTFTITGVSPTFTFTNTATTTGTATYTWDFGDGSATSALMNPSHTYTTNGTFIVSLVVQDSCGTDALDQTVTVTGVGLNELSLVDVAVYPNPSNGIFSIEASANMEAVYITDLSGKLIYTGDLSGQDATINASQFANGTYFLSIRFADDMIQTVRLEVVK